MSQLEDDGLEAAVSNNLRTALECGAMINDRYRVEELLGEGGVGAVYRVHQVFLGKDMALKMLHRGLVKDAVLLRFQQEAKTAAALNHKYLVKVIDFGILDDSSPFLVMELLDGITLGDYLQKCESINYAEAIPLFIKICEGLSFAHRNDIVHRDIKPGNIMLLNKRDSLSGDIEIKIVDFGIAKSLQPDGEEIQSLTQTGEIFGSPFYMSPEQCARRNVDWRADIYSLGCVFFECLCGEPPFQGATALDTITQHLREAPPKLRHFVEDVPQALENLIERMLAKAPNDRPENLEEVIRKLKELSWTTNPEGGQNDTDKTVHNRSYEYRRIVWPLAAFALTAVVILYVSTFQWKSDQPVTPPKQSAEINVIVPLAGTDDFVTLTPRDYPRSQLIKKSGDKAFWQCNIPRIFGNYEIIDQQQVVKNRSNQKRHSNFSFPLGWTLKLEANKQIALEKQDVFKKLAPESVSIMILQGCNVDVETVRSLSRLSGLERINLANTDCDDQCIPYLNQLPNLRSLVLESTKVTREGLNKLQGIDRADFYELRVSYCPGPDFLLEKLNPGCRVLSLSSCDADTKLIKKILRFKNLEALDLSHSNKIANEDIALLAKLPKLKCLELKNCMRITHDGINRLKNHDKLQSIRTTFDEKELGKISPDFARKAVVIDGRNFKISKGKITPLNDEIMPQPQL